MVGGRADAPCRYISNAVSGRGLSTDPLEVGSYLLETGAQICMRRGIVGAKGEVSPPAAKHLNRKSTDSTANNEPGLCAGARRSCCGTAW